MRPTSFPSTVSKIAETTSGGASVSAALSTALDSAVTLVQSGTNDGTIDWTFTLDNSFAQYLADGESVTAHYSIDVKDDSGTATDTFSQSMSVTITGTNDRPTLNVIDIEGEVTEDASTPNLTDTGSVTFGDADDTDVLTSAVAKLSHSTTGGAIPTALITALDTAVTLNQVGTNDGTINWTFTLDNDLVQYLGAGESVEAVYSITVMDDSGTANDTIGTSTMGITINGTNDQPTITVVDVTGAVTEDATTPMLTDNGSVDFAEVDDTDVLTASVAKTSETTSSAASIPSALTTALDGAVGISQVGSNEGTVGWTFTLDNSLVQYLAEGETVTAVYTITVQDDSSAANDSATEDVTVTITGTNDQPTVGVVDINGAVTEDASTPNLTDTGSITFAEVDETDVLSSSVSKVAESTAGGASVSSALSTALDSGGGVDSNRHQRRNDRLDVHTGQ